MEEFAVDGYERDTIFEEEELFVKNDILDKMVVTRFFGLEEVDEMRNRSYEKNEMRLSEMVANWTISEDQWVVIEIDKNFNKGSSVSTETVAGTRFIMTNKSTLASDFASRCLGNFGKMADIPIEPYLLGSYSNNFLVDAMFVKYRITYLVEFKGHRDPGGMNEDQDKEYFLSDAVITKEKKKGFLLKEDCKLCTVTLVNYSNGFSITTDLPEKAEDGNSVIGEEDLNVICQWFKFGSMIDDDIGGRRLDDMFSLTNELLSNSLDNLKISPFEWKELLGLRRGRGFSAEDYIRFAKRIKEEAEDMDKTEAERIIDNSAIIEGNAFDNKTTRDVNLDK
jgi:hypothetical protein